MKPPYYGNCFFNHCFSVFSDDPLLLLFLRVVRVQMNSVTDYRVLPELGMFPFTPVTLPIGFYVTACTIIGVLGNIAIVLVTYASM